VSNTYKLRLSGIVKESIVDGFGLRYVIFTQGCLQRCFNCHNQHTWDLDGGYFMDIEDIIQDLNNYPLIQGVTFSGGEPFLQVEPLVELASRVHKMKLDVTIFTGYIYEDLIKQDVYIPLLNSCDYLIDGPFINSLKNLDLTFRGSSNQRIIDMKATRLSGRVICIED
jgi:anaerobic ribonucleoside-triphosphate reductase activating protein